MQNVLRTQYIEYLLREFNKKTGLSDFVEQSWGKLLLSVIDYIIITYWITLAFP